MGNSSGALGKSSTAKEVVDYYSHDNNLYLKGKVAIVTGGNSGIGCETVKALAYAGCRVIMACRRLDAAAKVIQTEMKCPGIGKYVVPDDAEIIVKQLDLESLSSIQQFAQEVLDEEGRIDFLVLNAGIMALPNRQLTENGWEKQIAVNHMGHQYLSSLLSPKMVEQDHPSRIVVVASSSHKMGSLRIENMHFQQKRKYSPWKAYGQSKLANILFTKALADRLRNSKVSVFCLHPGIVSTHLTRHQNALATAVIDASATKTVPQGASTTLFACLEPSLSDNDNALSGSYLFDCSIKLPNAIAQDKEGIIRHALWNETEHQLQAALHRSLRVKTFIRETMTHESSLSLKDFDMNFFADIRGSEDSINS